MHRTIIATAAVLTTIAMPALADAKDGKGKPAANYGLALPSVQATVASAGGISEPATVDLVVSKVAVSERTHGLEIEGSVALPGVGGIAAKRSFIAAAVLTTPAAAPLPVEEPLPLEPTGPEASPSAALADEPAPVLPTPALALDIGPIHLERDAVVIDPQPAPLDAASPLSGIAAVVNAPATRQQTQVAVKQANAALRATTPGTTPTPPAVVEPGVIDPGTVPPADPVLPTTTR